MFKRIGLFLLVNGLVIVTIGIVTSLLGVRGYITKEGIDFSALLIFSAVVGFSGALISLGLSRIMAKWAMGVRVIDPNGPMHPIEKALLDEVYSLSRKAGLKVMPEVGIYDSPEVNAFATGPSKNRSLVAVSSGLLERMDDDAVSGVLAHEVAHIANGDMVTMTLLQGVINTFVVFLSRICAYIASRFVKEEVAPIVHFIAVIIFDILFSILGSMVAMAFSRYREYRADAGGAQLAGKEKMIHALQSLQHTVQLVDTEQKSVAAFKISGKKGGFLGLFASHPDLDDRIARLQAGR
ncbi:protease HtpX [Aneurinibacillus migulanus]|uniref:Protease HtpX homolog n=1 Tax=Aneurinibacillus migulanus TaxID=47500 RepID=A0A0D1XB79_ANEMI|nr:protease HtpX [Aneurinibacillus migulanus]KIV51254.1 protease HtpX [Aneurinibacillus migulanus]KIV51621.1 protease HtpX [Aneurinibacillus migulanus]KON94722.1 protease HtpX [Aneurinibacillus migulanus]KPD08247.1 protease HtpX [Aneurinibacillus migulanus]MCP1354551.1 protease HtpX [Aneurinibacillus migulanus]